MNRADEIVNEREEDWGRSLHNSADHLEMALKSIETAQQQLKKEDHSKAANMLHSLAVTPLKKVKDSIRELADRQIPEGE